MDSAAPHSMKHLLPFVLLILFLLRHDAAAAAAAAATLPGEALPTKSGYLRVNSTTGSAIFYAFYEAQNTSSSSLSETPLLVWLQGGPGCSSMIGNFLELGPWRVNSTLGLEPNAGAWNRMFGVLFLDNPIGTGFSIAATPEEIPRDQKSVAEHLLTAIASFVGQNPGFGTRSIYITGESYAGKYVPAIGYYILKKNAYLPAQNRVNLRGVAVGNGLTHPEVQVTTHAANAYFSGLINERQKREIEIAQHRAVELTQKWKWSEAADARYSVLKLLQNMTGLATLYDFTKKQPYPTERVVQLLRSPGVAKALGANESIAFEECSDTVGTALHGDVMKSAKFMVEALVRETKVLLYQGQSDLRDGVVSTEAWVRTMTVAGIQRFLEAERKVWSVNGELAGYVQKWGNLSHVVVMGAGHFVPADQSLNSQAMIQDWVLGKGLFATVAQQNLRPDSRFTV